MKFLYLNVLFLMLIPTLVLIYLLLTKQTNLTKYFSQETINKLSISNKYFSQKTRNIFLFLALICFIIALARPVTNEKTISSTNKTIPIVIALDVSKSMMANDVYPNRLTFAKSKLLEIINYSKQNSIAVILFAKTSYILSPLTSDFNSLKILIDNLNIGTNFDNGTNIYSVIETSNKLLNSFSNKNIILLTDGGDNTNFKEEIDLANENKTKIYTLAIATTKGSAIKLQNGNYLTDKKGNIVNLKLNDSIKNLSLETNAGFIKYTLNQNDIKNIIDDINKSATKENIQNQKRKVFTELFYYPLGLGIFLLLIAFSSMPTISKFMKKSFIILFTIFLTNQNDLLAFEFQTIEKAQNGYKKGNYQGAIKEFKSLEKNIQRDYNLANSYYKNKDYEKAINLYKNIKTNNRDLNFQKLHNLGNSYAKTNKFEEAIKTYQEALKIKNDKDTKENLEIIKKLKNKKQEKSKKNKSKNKNDKNNRKEKNQNKQKKNSNKNKSKNKNESTKKKENINKKIMSDYEEKKWLKQLEQKKFSPLIKKMKPSNEDSSFKPW